MERNGLLPTNDDYELKNNLNSTERKLFRHKKIHGFSFFANIFKDVIKKKKFAFGKF